MKKFLFTITAIALCISVCSCGSSPEKELEEAKGRAREAQEAYENSAREYDQLQKDLNRLNSMQNSIKNAK